MPFDMQCNMCGVTLHPQENQVGLIMNCPSCGQVIFVQSPSPAAGPTSDTPPASQETIGKQTATASELSAFLSRAQGSTPRPTSDSLAEPDTVSSLAEMLGGEDQPSIFVPPVPAPFAPTRDPHETTEFSFTPAASSKNQAGISTLALPTVAEPAPGADRMPWEPQPVPTPVTSTPAARPRTTEFFLPGASHESSPTAAPILGRGSSAATSEPVSPSKPQSRFGTMVAVYVSGMIFGLILGKFIFGKAAPSGLELIRDDGANKHKTEWIIPTAPVPNAQRKRIGETINLGHLAVTALGVERTKISLERLDPSGEKEIMTSPEECLVLRIRLKNTSTDVEFAPLDETFLRTHDPNRRPTYSFIELADGKQIKMYELLHFSEWNIAGQSFETIEPGEEMEAIIAAASGSPASAKGKMLWRIHLRAGGPNDNDYSTVVGFEFTADQIRG